jgi:hypothetical protein
MPPDSEANIITKEHKDSQHGQRLLKLFAAADAACKTVSQVVP